MLRTFIKTLENTPTGVYCDGRNCQKTDSSNCNDGHASRRCFSVALQRAWIDHVDLPTQIVMRIALEQIIRNESTFSSRSEDIMEALEIDFDCYLIVE